MSGVSICTMKRLKILFLSNRIPFPIKDGHSRRTYNILRCLSERHDIYFLSLDEDPESCSLEILGHLKGFCWEVELIRAPSKKLSFSMIIRLLRSLLSYKPYTIWRHYSVAFSNRVVDLANSDKFDIVHCDILPLAYALKRVKNTPCTITDHDVCYLKSYRLSKQSSNLLLKAFIYFESLKLKRFERRIFAQVSLGITVSETDKKILKTLCPAGNFLIGENGVDINKFKPGWENVEPKTILWVGGFSYMPNREGIYYFLKKIYPIIKRDVCDLKLILVGGGVTEWLVQLSVSDPSVKLIGYVDDPLPFIQAATVFVVPLLSGSGTRLKILEAMAAGKAIVTTTLGSEGIEGTDGVHYVVADKPEEFAKSVVRIMHDAEFRKCLGSNGRKLVVEKYNWENIIDKIDFAYQQLANQPL